MAMLFVRRLRLSALGALLMFVTAAASSSSLRAAQLATPVPRNTGLPNFVELAQKLEPAVVNISTTQAATRQSTPGHPFGEQNPFGGNDPLNEFWRRFFGDQFSICYRIWCCAIVRSMN